jgi:hypothetical protein
VENSTYRVITEVKVEGRAPTNSKVGQGDHTIAETLIAEAVQGVCKSTSRRRADQRRLKLDLRPATPTRAGRR